MARKHLIPPLTLIIIAVLRGNYKAEAQTTQNLNVCK